MNIISRGSGQSAIASASYRSGEELYSERYGKSNHYPREVSPETFILKPEHAPEWTLNREQLWNGVEEIEKRKDSQLAREFTIALPRELNNEEQNNLVREYVQNDYVDKGMVADVAIHRDKEGNPHAHVMLTVRPFLENGEWGNKQKTIYIYDDEGNKVRTEAGNFKSKTERFIDWGNKSTLRNWRKSWSNTVNKYLEKNNFSERITEKSFAELAIDKIPTIHEGYVARDMEKKGEVSERCETNRQINKKNKEKYEERKAYAQEEKSKTISNSLSPDEKGKISDVAKHLKVNVDYESLIDKQRMVRNWENSLKYNRIIQDVGIDKNTLESLSETKDNIEIGKEILDKQADRILKKYYPELNEQTNYKSYYKMAIAQETLENDKVLEPEEIVQVLEKAKDNRLDFMMKSIVKNPYKRPIEDYQKPLAYHHQNMKNFYEENNVTRNTVDTLSEEKQEEFKTILKKRDINMDTLEILDKYYTETIKEKYPTVDVSDININEKEGISKAIDYYGDDYSIRKLMRIVNEEQVNKFSYADQKIGVQMIYNLENNQMSEQTFERIENHYRYRKIYDVVSDKNMRDIFIEEAESNGLTIDQSVHLYEEYEQKEQYSFASLVGKVNLLGSVVQANQENIQNEQQEKAIRAKKKKKEEEKKKRNMLRR